MIISNSCSSNRPGQLKCLRSGHSNINTVTMFDKYKVQMIEPTIGVIVYKQGCNLNRLWIIFIFSILFPIFLFSQVATSWVVRYDGPISSEDVAYSMVIDEYANVYVTGWSNDLHSLNIARDCATVKYDTDGNELWAARYSYPGGDWGDWCYAIALDPFGNVCVTGAVQSAYKIGSFKYDNNGNVLWEMDYQPPLYDDNFGTAVTTDPLGNVYVAAFSYNPECGYRII